MILTCGQIHGRIGVKEIIGFEFEADVFHRHHREIFRLADMGVTIGVPQHKIGIFDIPVLLGIHRQTVALVLIRIVTRAITFSRIIRRYPDMIGSKPGTLANIAIGLRQHHRIVFCHQLVTGMIANRVGFVGVDDFPETPALAVRFPSRLLL